MLRVFQSEASDIVFLPFRNHPHTNHALPEPATSGLVRWRMLICPASRTQLGIMTMDSTCSEPARRMDDATNTLKSQTQFQPGKAAATAADSTLAFQPFVLCSHPLAQHSEKGTATRNPHNRPGTSMCGVHQQGMHACLWRAPAVPAAGMSNAWRVQQQCLACAAAVPAVCISRVQQQCLACAAAGPAVCASSARKL